MDWTCDAKGFHLYCKNSTPLDTRREKKKRKTSYDLEKDCGRRNYGNETDVGDLDQTGARQK